MKTTLTTRNISPRRQPPFTTVSFNSLGPILSEER
jgi:hypothetical protein